MSDDKGHQQSHSLTLCCAEDRLGHGDKGTVWDTQNSAELGLESGSPDSQTRILSLLLFPNLPQGFLFFELVPCHPALFSTIKGAKMK